jgi:predicted lipoprotein with Yx(FWY)xxD motif
MSDASKLPSVTPADISIIQEGRGYVLRAENDMAIYTYDRDSEGKSACVDTCAVNWPPVLSSSGKANVVGEFKTIPRGSDHQWTFRGKPLYTYAKDASDKPTGDGVGGVWHLVVL